MEEPSHATSPIFLLRFQRCPLSFAIESNWGNSLTFKTWQIWAQIRWPPSFWKLLFFFFSSYSTFTLFPLKLASSHSLAFCWISRTHRKVLASPFRLASLLQQVCLTSLDRLLPQRLTTGDKQAKNSEKVSEHKWKERISAINLKATAFLSTWPSSQHELQILKI